MRALWGFVAVAAAPAAFWLATLVTAPESQVGPSPVAAAQPTHGTPGPAVAAPIAWPTVRTRSISIALSSRYGSASA